MSENKSLFLEIAELLERRRQRRETTDQTISNGESRLLRYLLPNVGSLLLVALLVLTAKVWAAPLVATTNAPGPSATTVNYQGRLADTGGNPENGTFSMSFTLYDAATDGNIVWGPEVHPAVPVSEGLFNVGLGSLTGGGIPTTAWNGDIYLEVSVNGEALTPRELIRSVPIAGMALTVPDGAIGTEQIAAGAITNVEAVTIGPGAGNVSTDSDAFTDIPGYEITMDTTSGPVLLTFQATIRNNTQIVDGYVYLDFSVDGARVGGSNGINRIVNSSDLSEPSTTTWIVTPPAGTHTFRVQWRGRSGNGGFMNRTVFATQFSAIELVR